MLEFLLVLAFLFVVLCVIIKTQMPLSSLWLLGPKKSDAKRFPSNKIAARIHESPQNQEGAHEFSYSKQDWGALLKINDWTSDVPVFTAIKDFFKGHNTNAFLLIQRDTILYEGYFRGTGEKTLHSSYSMAKSFTSALVGIAIGEGLIKNVHDPITNYLTELKGQKRFDEVSLHHLLNHTSGIKKLLTLDANLYYGKIADGMKQVRFCRAPGKQQEYLNVNTQLLGFILKRVTKRPLSEYLTEKIWQPLGMESDAFWSTDAAGMEKCYCCINATARDFARFGRLYLQGGNWDGQQIIPADWVAQSIRRDRTQGSSDGYNYSWHIGLKAYGDFMAIGLYKQHIYVCPKEEIIMVLLNDKENALKAERVVWWYVFRQIVDLLDDT